MTNVTIDDNDFFGDEDAETYVRDNSEGLDLDAVLKDQGNTFDPDGVVSDNRIVAVGELNLEFEFVPVAPGEKQWNGLTLDATDTGREPLVGVEITLTVEEGDGEFQVDGESVGTETTVATNATGAFVEEVKYI